MSPFPLNPNPAARSVHVFGLYLCVTGATLLLAPAVVLAPLDIAVPQDVWIRLVGILALALGVTDVIIAREGVTTLIRWSVGRRLAAGAAILALVGVGLAPMAVALFAAVDIAAAAWTAIAMRHAPMPGLLKA